MVPSASKGLKESPLCCPEKKSLVGHTYAPSPHISLVFFYYKKRERPSSSHSGDIVSYHWFELGKRAHARLISIQLTASLLSSVPFEGKICVLSKYQTLKITSSSLKLPLPQPGLSQRLSSNEETSLQREKHFEARLCRTYKSFQGVILFQEKILADSIQKHKFELKQRIQFAKSLSSKLLPLNPQST